MLKNKRTIITVAIIVVILFAVAIGFILGSKDEREITYINEKRGAEDKIAVIINGEDNSYVVTIDEQYKVNKDEKFFDTNNSEDDFQVVIEDTVYDAAYISDDDISIEAQKKDFYYDNEKIVKQDDRWLLVKNEDSSYIIYYCMDKEFDSKYEEEYFIEAPISLGNLYDVEENEAIERYEKIKTIANVYRVKENDNSIDFEDYQGITVNLDDYNFARDLITKSLFEYDIYIRNSRGIKDCTDKFEVSYETPDDENKTRYEISLCDSDYIEANKKSIPYEVNYNLEYNNKTYEVMTTELGASLNFYTQIGEDSYLHIFMTAEDMSSQSIQENVEIFVERIKQQLL